MPNSELYNRILVATDGSDGSQAAAHAGLAVAERYGGTVHAVYVLDTNTYAFEDVPRSIVGLLKESGTRAIEEIAETGREQGIDVKTGLLRGTSSQEVLDYAERNGIDLLTLGAHGQTSETHLGSTTERVIRTARQPTLSVR